MNLSPRALSNFCEHGKVDSVIPLSAKVVQEL